MIGIILAILVAIIWAIGELFYSKATFNISKNTLLVYQYLFAAIMYFFVVLIFDKTIFANFKIDEFFMVVPIVVLNIIGSSITYIAIKNGKLSIVSPVMAAYPIITTFVSCLFLKENVSVYQIIASFLITISIIILSINKVKDDNGRKKHIVGLVAAVMYMILISVATFLEKYIYIVDFSIVRLFYYSSILYFIAFIFALFFIVLKKETFVKPNLDLTLGVGFANIGNLLSSAALFLGNMIVVTPIMALYTILTNYLSRTILKEKISILHSICIGVIILSTLFIIILGVL